MIRIEKGHAPPSLIRSGNVNAELLRDSYNANPQSFLDGSSRMAFRESIYSSASVKAALELCHHGKCCYCETHIPKPYAFAHVEHWRPKSSVRQEPGGTQLRPGYYWLAYEWDNLLLSCSYCNSAKKSDLFPLQNPEARARHHGMSIDNEQPLILKPDGTANLCEHISFHLEVPVGLTPIGRTTIEVLGLDSPAHESRLSYFAMVRDAWLMCVSLSESEDPKAKGYAERSKAILLEAVKPPMPYSAMVANFLAANPLP